MWIILNEVMVVFKASDKIKLECILTNIMHILYSKEAGKNKSWGNRLSPKEMLH